MNEYDLQERAWQGQQARDVLENETFKWAFESIEKDLVESWKTSPARDVDGREKVFLMLQLLKKFETTIRSRMETGKLAELELIHKQGLASRLRETWQSLK